MGDKTTLLTAIRDTLVAGATAAGRRVYVVAQDAQGNQLLPKEAACPFLTVADAGGTLDWRPGTVASATYRVRVRAHVQDLRDVETPVLGHAGSSTVGAAALQATIRGLLAHNLLAARVSGVEAALVEAEPAVDVLDDGSWWAVIGDVLLRYEMTLAG